MSTLHRWTQSDGEWACAAYDHGPFCRLCQKIDPNDRFAPVMLDGVATGDYTVKAASNGELLFKLTDQGIEKARALVARMGYDPDDPVEYENAAREIARNPDMN